MKKIGVALLGLGTVGGGTYRILQKERVNIKKRYGVDLEVRRILERNTARAEELGVDPAIVSTDINDVLRDPEIKVVAEFFGGIEPAKSFLVQSLLAGKSIVTANKEMFSKNWHELEDAAKKGKAGLYFEATCAGGVPIIKTLTESMQGNDIQSITGIVNGTTNYILSKMDGEKQEYSQALKKAQELGYAEADPTADVEAYDSMYKLSILSSLAFHTHVPIDKIYREGISAVDKADMDFGKQFGYTLKLLAIAKKQGGKIEARVHPTFISSGSMLSSVRGSFNAVSVVGDNVGEVMLYGKGAGDLPTGSAIVSDIVTAAGRIRHSSTLGKAAKPSTFSIDFVTGYYLRMTVYDRKGALAAISNVFAKNGISVKTLHQIPREQEDCVNCIFILHKTKESGVKKALEEFAGLSFVAQVDALIRVEE